MPKISDWKIIATEGPTVDGRKITRDWIEQMAASYDPKEYTALIWPEHLDSMATVKTGAMLLSLKLKKKMANYVCSRSLSQMNSCWKPTAKSKSCSHP